MQLQSTGRDLKERLRYDDVMFMSQELGVRKSGRIDIYMYMYMRMQYSTNKALKINNGTNFNEPMYTCTDLGMSCI